jgi:hypothetical protein
MNYTKWYGSRRSTLGSLWRPARPAFGGRSLAWSRGPGAYRGSPGYRGGYQRGYSSRYGARPGWGWQGQGFQQRLPHWGWGGYRQPGALAGPQPGGPDWVRWAQSILAAAVGPWVPQDGVFGTKTRKAILIFQGRQQLPATGLLDNATFQALQAFTAQPPSPPPPPPPEPVVAVPPGPDPSAAAAAGPGDGAAQPPPDASAQAPDAGAAQPDAPAGEFGFSPWRRRRFENTWRPGFGGGGFGSGGFGTPGWGDRGWNRWG